MINILYNRYKKQVEQYKKIKGYYQGTTDALTNYTETNRSNIKVNLNYLKKFVKEETAYSVGNPISYQSKTDDKEKIAALDEVMGNYKENHDINTFRKMVLYGLVYEITYIDKFDNLNVKTISPTDAYHEEDSEGNIINFIHVYTVTEVNEDTNMEEEKTYIDEYTDKEINIYKCDGDPILQKTIPHFFEEIPVGMAKKSEDTWRDTIYNDIKGIQDALETNVSDITNEISDFRNAYMVLRGISVDEDEAEKLKQKGIIEAPEEGGVDWLIKNINDSFIQNTIGNLHEKLYEITSHINHNDAQQMSNASGVALKSRLIALTQICSINEGAFKELLKTRIRLIFKYLEITEKKKYDPKDIKIRFTPTIPNDDNQTADLIGKLNGKVSAGTLLSLLSFVEDGQVEFEKAQKEKSKVDALNEVLSNVRSRKSYIEEYSEYEPEAEITQIIKEKSELEGTQMGEFATINTAEKVDEEYE